MFQKDYPFELFTYFFRASHKMADSAMSRTAAKITDPETMPKMRSDDMAHARELPFETTKKIEKHSLYSK